MKPVNQLTGMSSNQPMGKPMKQESRKMDGHVNAEANQTTIGFADWKSANHKLWNLLISKSTNQGFGIHVTKD